MHFLTTFQENMTRMLMVTDVQDVIKKHQSQIITSLKDPDIRLVFYHLSISLFGLWTRIFIFLCSYSEPVYLISIMKLVIVLNLKLLNLDCIYQNLNLDCNVVLMKHVFLICFLLRNYFGICTYLWWQFLAGGSVVFWRFHIKITGLDEYQSPYRSISLSFANGGCRFQIN